MAVSKSVTVIPARKHARKGADEEKPKLRVAAYCRVSTDSDEQATSYDTQIEHYTTYIQGQPDWVLAGIFADDGHNARSPRNGYQGQLISSEKSLNF
jgi:site-specific DNA recombinase